MMWQEEFELFLQYRHDYKAEKNMGGGGGEVCWK